MYLPKIQNCSDYCRKLALVMFLTYNLDEDYVFDESDYEYTYTYTYTYKDKSNYTEKSKAKDGTSFRIDEEK